MAPLRNVSISNNLQFFPVFILILILILFPCPSAATTSEAEALLKWKNSLHNPTNHSLLPSWNLLPSYNSTSPSTNSSRRSCCKWIGIVCNVFGSVTEINLTSSNLKGTLQYFNFSSFPNLLAFVLTNNSLYGSIPPQISNLSTLTNLNLGWNQLSGNIPFEIGMLVSLEVFWVHNNSLSGNLSNLENLGISDNSLTGNLPENICLGGKLKRISAYNNHFTGSIPKSLRYCNTLVRVNLKDNLLTGNISEEFGVYSNLYFMDLSNNKFGGELSGNWGKCPKLMTLNFSNNKISGTLSPELGKAIQLHTLDLSSNLLVGKIPEALGNLKLLFKLILNNNSFSGQIPTEIGMLSQLEQLDLSKNELSGQIPMHLGQCSKLLHLNLRNNRFSGTVPFQIGSLRSLQDLDLSQNFLTGQLPFELGHLQILETFNISHNNFSGSIPSTFKEMLSLTSVDVSYNQLEGSLPHLKAFIEAPIEALENNRGLCGNNPNLKPCPIFKKKSNEVVIISVIVSILLTVLLFFLIVGVLLIRRKRERNHIEEPRVTQNKTFFVEWGHDGKKVHQEIVEATENFDSKYCIGVGGYGSVYKTQLSTGQVVAVKKIHENGGVANEEAFESETSILTKIRHRNIIKLYGFCLHSRHSFLVYEFMERGSLAKILTDDGKAVELVWAMRVNVVKGLANAVSYMHHECCPCVVHRDISSKNVLLDGDYEAHLSDFGSARTVDPDSSNWTSFAGTFGYAAPACFHDGSKREVRCVQLRVVTLEVIMGSHPGDLISSLPHHRRRRRQQLFIMRFCLGMYWINACPSKEPNSKAIGFHCTYSICMSASKSTISANYEASF
ncbi:hypothetical protein FNV43_RR00771 [Rhamnella rubrinervis]|uniref:non-specific serine/threonine protein kinase n=1 Tax=Rhamnella rubrinervis TaxID=2594499 RepID=A0A8K0HQ72_9ROSA|nr:hypothetical protein FNV43_RR00771 [Rhamnella rubrinervis]